MIFSIENINLTSVRNTIHTLKFGQNPEIEPYQARIELVLSTARVTSIKSEKGVEGT